MTIGTPEVRSTRSSRRYIPLFLRAQTISLPFLHDASEGSGMLLSKRVRLLRQIHGFTQSDYLGIIPNNQVVTGSNQVFLRSLLCSSCDERYSSRSELSELVLQL